MKYPRMMLTLERPSPVNSIPSGTFSAAGVIKPLIASSTPGANFERSTYLPGASVVTSNFPGEPTAPRSEAGYR